MWRVLIVEDDPHILRQMMDGLQTIAECTCASNGPDAVRSFRDSFRSNTPFDFILLDVIMPGMNGFDVLRQIRTEEAGNKIEPAQEVRVIMTTTFKDSLMERYNMGWDDFITKPVETDKLIGHMQALLDSKTTRA